MRQAVRDHARRRLQPRQQDRQLAHRAPVYVDLLPPCNDACPAGENIQPWLYEAEEGGDGYERAWRKIMEDNPFPAVMGRVCYHPCETACNRGAARRGGRHQLRRALPRRRGDRAGLDGRGRRAAVRQARARRRRRPVRALRRLPPRPARPRRDRPRRRAAAGGMMRFGIPRYRLPRDVLDAEIARIARPRRDARARRQGRRRPRRDARRGGSTPSSSPSARTSASAPTSRPARRRAILDAVIAAPQHGGRGAAAARPARRGLRRRQHGDGRARTAQRLGATEASSSTAAPATACPRTTSRSRRPRRRASG